MKLGWRWRIQGTLSHVTRYTSACASVVMAIFTICNYNRRFLGLRANKNNFSLPVSGGCGLSLMTMYVKVTHP